MKKKKLLCIFALSGLPLMLQAAGTTPLHEGWRLQSACKLRPPATQLLEGLFDGRMAEVSVPTHSACGPGGGGRCARSIFGLNLRTIPGNELPDRTEFSNLPMPADSPYHCGWWYRTEFARPAAAGAGAFLVALWRHQLSRRDLGERP